MAIGLITSPATWLNGTVVAPAWLQQVQDNLNGLMNGTGPTLTGVVIDGIGGAAPSLQAKSHLVISGTAPGLAAGAGAGTSPTLSVVYGSDCIGMITLTCGTTPTAGSTIMTVTFAAGMGRSVVSLTPANGNAAQLTGANIVIATPNVAGGSWTLGYAGGGGVLSAGIQYQWFYTAFGTSQ